MKLNANATLITCMFLTAVTTFNFTLMALEADAQRPVLTGEDTYTLGQLIEGQAHSYLEGRRDAIRECSLFGRLTLDEHQIPCSAPVIIETQEM